MSSVENLGGFLDLATEIEYSIHNSIFISV